MDSIITYEERIRLPYMNLEKATDKLTAGPGKEVALIEYETEGLWLYEKGP